MAQTTATLTDSSVFPGFPHNYCDSQRYTPCPGLLALPSPQDHSPPRNSWQAVKQDKNTMDSWSYHPLGALQAPVNAACSCNLVTSSLRGPLSSSTQSPRKTRAPDAQVGRTPGRAQTLCQPTPLHPHAHPAPTGEEGHPGRDTQTSPVITFLLRHQSNVNAKNIGFCWITPIKQIQYHTFSSQGLPSAKSIIFS